MSAFDEHYDPRIDAMQYSAGPEIMAQIKERHRKTWNAALDVALQEIRRAPLTLTDAAELDERISPHREVTNDD